MPSAGERFLMGLVKSGRGISRAYVQALIDQERQEQREREEQRQARMDALQGRYMESRIAKMQEQEEPKEKKGFALSAGQARYEWDEESKSFKEVAKLPAKEGKETRPEDKTGIGEFEDVVSRRRAKTGKARTEAGEKIVEAFEDIFTDPETDKLMTGLKYVSPEKLADYVRSKVPPTIKQGGFLGIGAKDVVNPQVAEMEKILAGIAIPPEFQIPQGAGARALADSIETARTDPAMAAAVMDFQQEEQEDPEIAKARQALEAGEIDQATFDDFVRKRNASLVR